MITILVRTSLSLALVTGSLAPGLATPHAPLARAGTIEGTVTDSASGRPVPNAHVVVIGTAHSAVADSLGEFRIAGIAAGSYDIRAAFVGYRPVERKSVRVFNDSTTTLHLTLVASAVELQQLTVVAADRALVPRDQVTSKQLVPGSYGQRVTVAANSFDDASVTTGATSAEFGSAQGGVVGITGRSTDGRRLVRAPDRAFNTEGYARIVDNPFLAAAVNPLSTFSIDVDRASYSNVRRFIQSGRQPPPDAVRLEEMVNYFPYDNPAPEAGSRDPFTITTEVTSAPWQPANRLVRIALQARRVDTRDLPPSNLVFLIDVSGSMQAPNKLALVKRALGMLVEQLREQDRVALVVYAGAAGLVLPSTSGADKEAIRRAIEGLEAGGSTAGGAGITLAYGVAREHRITGGNNRVILATDGDFNIGASSDAEMERLIEEQRQHGVFLTVLGFGMGNYKDSKLETLADKGNGNYAYIDSEMEARKTLVSEFGGTLLTVAKDVKIQVEFNPALVQGYRLLGYENRALRAEDFADDRKDAGEIGAGHAVTALYEVVPTGVESPVAIRGIDSLRYQPASMVRNSRGRGELLYVKVRYKAPDADTSQLLTHPVPDRVRPASSEMRFASAVAAFGMILRGSEYRGSATLDDVTRLARSGLGRDAEGYRADFLTLVDAYRKLVPVAED